MHIRPGRQYVDQTTGSNIVGQRRFGLKDDAGTVQRGNAQSTPLVRAESAFYRHLTRFSTRSTQIPAVVMSPVGQAQADMRAQLFGMLWLPMLGQIGRRSSQYPAIGLQRTRDQPVVVYCADMNPEFVTFVDQVGDAIVECQFDTDLRVTIQVGGQYRHKALATKADRRHQSDLTAWAGLQLRRTGLGKFHFR
ncbi:hypothetical protein BCY88_24365 [Paraburkholderia fungorum]|uniref:Uncharacterized protein n=1 Tax=Paraburkholderia fungorum TaxID=134537 RepID=A0A420GQ67_9BURK|nr:hypothetical protein BCY88_24365 [Paraburkholderia fungorum]